jgi:hypothetical protein
LGSGLSPPQDPMSLHTQPIHDLHNTFSKYQIEDTNLIKTVYFSGSLPVKSKQS